MASENKLKGNEGIEDKEDHCFHMLNPPISNYQSILHWFQLHYL